MDNSNVFFGLSLLKLQNQINEVNISQWTKQINKKDTIINTDIIMLVFPDSKAATTSSLRELVLDKFSLEMASSVVSFIKN